MGPFGWLVLYIVPAVMSLSKAAVTGALSCRIYRAVVSQKLRNTDLGDDIPQVTSCLLITSFRAVIEKFPLWDVAFSCTK